MLHIKNLTAGYGKVNVLHGVSIDVNERECVALIGANGAGKSTLLKILSRVTTPTTGRINIKGRVASLLEVGTGFHPELTGRENIYLNGAILGMRKREIDRKLDEIIDFSGVERYIDTPVKRYSSGMYVRLAFAVAAHLESEILIVDEVLAVGDAEFQKKCLGKMGEVSMGEGRTVLFVSHNMASVRTLCKSGILLKNGTIYKAGAIDCVVNEFQCYIKDLTVNNTFENLDFYKVRFNIIEIDLIQDNSYLISQKLNIDITVFENEKIDYSFEFIVRDVNGNPVIFSPVGFAANYRISAIPNSKRKLSIIIHLPILANGTYSVDAMLVNPGIEFYHFLENAAFFSVDNSVITETGWQFNQARNQGVILAIPSIREINYTII